MSLKSWVVVAFVNVAGLGTAVAHADTFRITLYELGGGGPSEPVTVTGRSFRKSKTISAHRLSTLTAQGPH